ncbi:MAG: hypothetical protein KC553_04815 [Nitrospina sp.]|nr:hypothetical protein [Nitrospina sp.]
MGNSKLYLALVVGLFLLSQPLAFALPPANDVVADDMDNLIDDINVELGSIDSDNITDGSITANDLAAGAVGSSQIATGAVGSSQLAAGAVGSSQIASGAVGTSQLAAGAVTTSKSCTDDSGDTIVEDDPDQNGTWRTVTFADGDCSSNQISITPSSSNSTVLAIAHIAWSKEAGDDSNACLFRLNVGGAKSETQTLVSSLEGSGAPKKITLFWEGQISTTTTFKVEWANFLPDYNTIPDPLNIGDCHVGNINAGSEFDTPEMKRQLMVYVFAK